MRFEYYLKSLINERIADLLEQLANGNSVPDIGKYREYVGHIRGLREIIELCDEANLKMEED